jgi:hypothetical protein
VKDRIGIPFFVCRMKSLQDTWYFMPVSDFCTKFSRVTRFVSRAEM